jgi:ubiquinone/menaquinone biosynthesis C-methylase UbiE
MTIRETSTRVRPHKPYKGPAMEGFIASWYAKNTKGDARRYRECAEAVADRVAAGGTILEIAAGPGYLAVELAKLGRFRVAGLDISKTFVRIATENAREASVSVEFREGNAAELPYANESFDFVVCRAAFKNFSDPAGALREIHRVLRPGGQASIFDLRGNASRVEVAELVRSLNLSTWNAWWTSLTFRFFLLKNAYTKESIQQLAVQSPFGAGEVVESGVELDLRLTRRAVS